MLALDPDLYHLCLEHHREVRDTGFVVKDSLPIPYFGDLAAYLTSELRVLTAALNPSNAEFPAGEPRFDIAHGLSSAEGLEVELGAYFKRNPYRRWFCSFEPVLNGLGASYGGKMAKFHHSHTALHLDMCSPIATSPTWSRLDPDRRAKLTPKGREIFERLVDSLKPDLVIASVGWGHIEGWHADFSSGRHWEPTMCFRTTFEGNPMRSPLLVQVNKLESCNGHSYLFANGSAANTPFGRFHSARKQKVGRALLEMLKGTSP